MKNEAEKGSLFLCFKVNVVLEELDEFSAIVTIKAVFVESDLNGWKTQAQNHARVSGLDW
jgi:hypothetical protein